MHFSGLLFFLSILEAGASAVAPVGSGLISCSCNKMIRIFKIINSVFLYLNAYITIHVQYLKLPII